MAALLKEVMMLKEEIKLVYEIARQVAKEEIDLAVKGLEAKKPETKKVEKPSAKTYKK